MWDEHFSREEARQRFPLKDEYSFAELLDLMAFLRSPIGCPWDRKQTPQSIRASLLEESWETIDAIENGSPERVKDELGDVLLQVVFHAQMAQEAGQFTIDDVIANLCRKLISRHTHLFRDDTADSPEAVLSLWEKNKQKEKGLAREADVLRDVPRYLPTLSRAARLQKKAANCGFDWPDLQGIRDKIAEESRELEEARQELEAARKELEEARQATAATEGQPAGMASPPEQTAEQSRSAERQAQTEPRENGPAAVASQRVEAARAHVEEEAGDLLFALVNELRRLKVDPELALDRCNEKFLRRFSRMEELAQADGKALRELSLDEMDAYWEASKREERAEREEREDKDALR